MESKLDDILNLTNKIKSTTAKLINADNEQGKTLKSFTQKNRRTFYKIKQC